MTHWRDKYLQASFRGVEYWVKTATEPNLGRRVKVHLFPKSDDPLPEDLGAKERILSLSIRIVGTDYFKQRDELKAALSKKGSGRFIHPYMGEFTVVILSANVSESFKQGNVANFEISCLVVQDVKLIKETINTTEDVYIKRNSFLDELELAFKAIYDLGSQAVEMVNKVIKTVDTIAETILEARDSLSFVSEFQQAISTLRGKLVEVSFNSELLWESMVSLTTFGTDFKNNLFPATPENSKDAFFEIRKILNARLNISSSYDPTRHDNIIDNMVIHQCIVAMSGLLAVVEYESREEAEALRKITFDYLDNFSLEPLLESTILSSIRDTRASVELDINSRTDDLSNLLDYNIPDSSAPSITLAYNLYGDILNEDDIIQRNKIENPFFIDGTIRIIKNA